VKSVAIPILLGLAGIAFQPSSVVGQEGAFAFQLRGGLAIPSGEFRSGEGAWHGKSGQGAAFGMGFTFPTPGPFGAYLGFGQRHFSCDESVCPPGTDWISTGFDVALRAVIGEGGVRSWIQGGVHTHRMEGELLADDGEPRRITSEGGGGFEVGGGLLIAVGARTSLSPGLRYGWGEVPFKGQRAMELRYVIVDVGLVLGF
jgi:hypothetical protein